MSEIDPLRALGALVLRDLGCTLRTPAIALTGVLSVALCWMVAQWIGDLGALDKPTRLFVLASDAVVPPLMGGSSVALFLLVEGLDPLCLIATDSTAAAALGRAYRCEVPLGKPGRAFGRSVVAFRDFDAMLDDGQDKQIAWALLKKLPRFGE